LLLAERDAIASANLPVLVPKIAKLSQPHAPANSFRQGDATNVQAIVRRPRRKRDKVKNSSDTSASESDSGESALYTAGGLAECDVRLEALNCLIALAKGKPALLHPFWFPYLLPDAYSPSQANLLTIIERDSRENFKRKACEAIMALFKGSKPFLQLADERYILHSSPHL